MGANVLKRRDLDITPNYHDYPTAKSMVLVKGINVLILGMKGLGAVDSWRSVSD